jgi:hypothetical protein
MPSERRKKPTADEKVATLLLMHWHAIGDPIPFEIAKQMTAHQICSLVQWQHNTPWVWCKSNHPTILTPMIIADHRRVTAEIDIPRIAKVKRTLKRRAEPPRGVIRPKPKRKIPSRPFPSREERRAFKARMEARHASLS